MEETFQAQVQANSLNIRILKARLDAAAVARFKEQISAVWQDGLVQAEIDMSSVDFIDSSGVGALLSVYRRLPQGSATVTLRGMKPQVQAVIELLRLHRIFQLA